MKLLDKDNKVKEKKIRGNPFGFQGLKMGLRPEPNQYKDKQDLYDIWFESLCNSNYELFSKKIKSLISQAVEKERQKHNKINFDVKSSSSQTIFEDADGETEALVFDANIEKSRNPFMFEQYAKGYVKEHSVGMRYVDIFMCVNSGEQWAKEEKENWDKYYPEIINKDVADSMGYFWAVTTAKVIEGSAVVKGSNYATPTISVKEQEPPKSTPDKIENSRQSDTVSINEFKEILSKHLKN